MTIEQAQALNSIQNVLEKELKWSKEKSFACFDQTIVEQYNLQKMIDIIEYPTNVPKGDLEYVLGLIYPDMNINYVDMTIKVYEQVINKEIKQFPRAFFDKDKSAYALLRFRICLKHIVESFHPVKDVDEMYSFFLSPKGQKVLDQYRLKTPIRFYKIDLIEQIYELTKKEKHAKLYNLYYRFKREMSKGDTT